MSQTEEAGKLSRTEAGNLGDSGLEEHIAHWAEVLDHWVQSIDARLGRQDGGVPVTPLDEADGGAGAEQ